MQRPDRFSLSMPTNHRLATRSLGHALLLRLSVAPGLHGALIRPVYVHSSLVPTYCVLRRCMLHSNMRRCIIVRTALSPCTGHLLLDTPEQGHSDADGDTIPLAAVDVSRSLSPQHTWSRSEPWIHRALKHLPVDVGTCLFTRWAGCTNAIPATLAFHHATFARAHSLCALFCCPSTP